MYNSKEIRWFAETVDMQILGWFTRQGLSFDTTDPRTDFYLPLPDREDMSIKLREGNIEIKQRTGTPVLGKLKDGAEGYFEDWVKWSFNAKKDDLLSKAITQEKEHNWIKIYKERIGVKITKDANEKTTIVNIKDRIPYGCQFEYTRILINEKEQFTFALEWFGDKQLDLDPSLIADILSSASLEARNSMGYGGFLKSGIAKT